MKHLHILDARKAHILTLLKSGTPISIGQIQESLASLALGKDSMTYTSKTIMRDIKEMKSDGAIIKYSRSRGGYYLQNLDWEMNITPFLGGDELLITTMGTQLAAACLPGDFAKQAHNAGMEIAKRNSCDFSETNMEALKILVPPLASESELIFTTVFRAWKQKNILNIKYCDESGRTSERSIEPQALLFYDMAWYISSFCYLRNKPRTFALSRILEAAIVNRTFQSRPELYQKITFDSFDERDFYENISIKLTPAGHQFALAHVLHSEQTFREDIDGMYLMHIPRMSKHLTHQWIMRQCGEATPILPKILIEDMKKILNMINDKMTI